MSDSKHRISIKRIQVHPKCDLEGHEHPTVSIALKSGDTILGQKDSGAWGDLDWELHPPPEVYALDEISLEVTLGLDKPQSKHWVLAATTIVHPASLDGGALEGRAPLHLEHALASVEIYFAVDEHCYGHKAPKVDTCTCSDSDPATAPHTAHPLTTSADDGGIPGKRGDAYTHCAAAGRDSSSESRVGDPPTVLGSIIHHGARYGDLETWPTTEVPVECGRLAVQVKGNERPHPSRPLPPYSPPPPPPPLPAPLAAPAPQEQ